MPAQISDLWTPAIWVKAMRERQATFPALWNSGIVAKSDLMDQIASGAGTSANVPFLKDITDQADEVQVENTAPVTDNGAPGSVQNFPILNRVTKNSVTALATQVAGADPLTQIISSMTERRLKQRQTTGIAMLRGLFGSAGAINAAGALTAVRLGGTTAEPAIEAGAAATDSNLMTPDKFINAKALMGELGDLLRNGCFLCHPNVKSRLEILDSLNFKSLKMPSELPWDIQTYRDIPIFTSVALSRVGTISGFVYDSYLIARGAIGYGDKPQAGDVRDVAALQYWFDRALNNDLIYDRTRFILGVDGTNWTGIPAGQSATNAELQTSTNWSLVYQTANRCGVACIRTNG